MVKAIKKVVPKKKSVKAQKKLKKFNYPFTIVITLAALLLSIFVVVNALQQNQDQRSRAQVVDCTVSTTDMAIDSEEKKLLDELNAYRQQNGAPPLTISENLTRMAAWMSNDMFASKTLSHTDSLNRSPDVRAVDCKSPYGAENIARGFTDAANIMNFWKNSSSHNFNMLDPKYTVIGIARSGDYWTQDFATEDPGATVPTTEPPTSAPITNVPTMTAPTSPAGNPTSPVPNPECLGSCPTTAPTTNPSNPNPTAPEPTDMQNPDISGGPEDPTDPEPTNGDENPLPSLPADPGTGGGNGGGIIELFLAFLKLIFEFFASLFR